MSRQTRIHGIYTTSKGTISQFVRWQRMVGLACLGRMTVLCGCGTSLLVNASISSPVTSRRVNRTSDVSVVLMIHSLQHRL